VTAKRVVDELAAIASCSRCIKPKSPWACGPTRRKTTATAGTFLERSEVVDKMPITDRIDRIPEAATNAGTGIEPEFYEVLHLVRRGAHAA
jgi:hypothetical protein